MRIENLKDEIASIRKDIEPTFRKNLIETINQHDEENEKLKDKIKLLKTENKILNDNIGTKQKLIDSLLQHNNLLTQQERLTTELLTPTSENRCKRRNKNVIQTENNIHQEEITAKPGMSKGSKLPLKKSDYSNTSNRNKTSLFPIRN